MRPHHARRPGPAGRCFVAVLPFLLFVAAPAHAQTAASPRQIALACAPPAALAGDGRHALRIGGAQDTIARSVFDDHDLLIVRTGSAGAVSVGQQYFVRRPFSAPNYENRPHVRHPIHTAGWVRIVAVNGATAIALVEHACGSIRTGDYLEPFALPADPGELQTIDNPAGLDFGGAARVMYGADEHAIASPGEFLIVNRGADQGVSAGARFAVYRDVPEFFPNKGRMRSAGLPWAAIGEGVVVASGPATAVVQLLSARDAVKAGDYVVPRRR